MEDDWEDNHAPRPEAPRQEDYDALWDLFVGAGAGLTSLFDDTARYTTPPDERPLARVLPFRERRPK